MGCKSCKDKNVYQNKPHNALGNIALRGMLFIIGAILLPLFIPFMWYFLFTKLFFETKHMDLVNLISSFGSRYGEKRMEKKMMEQENLEDENEYEDFQIYQVDEIQEKNEKKS